MAVCQRPLSSSVLWCIFRTLSGNPRKGPGCFFLCVWLGSAFFVVWLGSAWLGSARLGLFFLLSVWHGSAFLAWLGLAWLLGSAWLGSAWLGRGLLPRLRQAVSTLMPLMCWASLTVREHVFARDDWGGMLLAGFLCWHGLRRTVPPLLLPREQRLRRGHGS